MDANEREEYFSKRMNVVGRKNLAIYPTPALPVNGEGVAERMHLHLNV